jgi:hypothetical protein
VPHAWIAGLTGALPRGNALFHGRMRIFGEGVGLMSVGADVLCRLAGRLAEEYGVGRRSHVADFSRAFSHLAPIFVARDIRAAEAAATRAAR